MDIIAAEDVARWAPFLDPADIDDVTAEANAAVARHAPCIDGSDFAVVALARGALRRILQASASYGVEYEQIGPFRLGGSSRGPLLLTAADIGSLQALCSGASLTPDLPAGAFPPPPCNVGLFPDRRR